MVVAHGEMGAWSGKRRFGEGATSINAYSNVAALPNNGLGYASIGTSFVSPRHLSLDAMPASKAPLLPTASIVVPTHGRPAAIGRCLEALASLDYPAPRLEVVVVDDSSPVPIDVRGLTFGGTLTVVRTPQNSGPAVARNLGARTAGGQILLFTDDDCRPEPAWAEALVRAVDRDPHTLAGGATVNGLPGNVYAQASQDLVTYLYRAFDRSRALAPFFTSNNIAVRRDAYLELDGFDESFRLSAAEDRDFSERWTEEQGTLKFVPDARVLHYHDMNLGRFLRQHYQYGRGAVHLARTRSVRGRRAPRPEPPRFYTHMLAHPFSAHRPTRALAVSALVALSQCAGLVGVAAELVRPKNDLRGLVR